MPFNRRAKTGKAASLLAVLQGVLLTTALLPVAQAALADELPAQLIEASKLIPATEAGRERCSAITGLNNLLRMPFSIGDHQTFASGNNYARDTKGAYLGDGPKGEPAPPFVQALLDAGAAKRVTLTWIERTTTPTGVIPHLQDTGAPARQEDDKPAFVTHEVRLEGDAFLVSGEDRKLFIATTNRFGQAPLPPEISGENSEKAGQPAGSPPTAPPGVWSTAKMCVVEVADRVLEYGDVQKQQNGVRFVSAAILFHPEKLPAWASDFRVAATARTVFIPQDVRFVTFRDDGDGWRPTPYPEPFFMRGKTHIVDGD